MAEERVRRRLAAILAADVVGYSRLMEADEAGTVARLKTLREEVFEPMTVRFGGRIFKTTGDGALAEFPSASDALQCAVDVQRALAARNADLPEDTWMELRIGLSLGDAIVDGDDLYGNGVNVAARLEGIAEPGGICVSDNVHEHVRNTAEIGFEDLGELEVKNIDRPVRVYRIALQRPERTGEKAKPALALPNKPSIAVLPFDNMSGDPEQEYFADGMTEDIITELSKISGLLIIARHSAFIYKGKSVTLKQVGHELGVRFVLEGSVRKAGPRVRITAQLIDALSDHHLWAERYDRDIEDIFALQDEVARQVAAALEVTLKPGERERLAHVPTDNINAYDLYMRTRPRSWPPIASNINSARSAYGRIIEIDPTFAGGFAGKAITHSMAALFGHSDQWETDTATAMVLARKAIELDPDFALSHSALGLAYAAIGQTKEAIAAARRATELQPGDADSHAWLARCLMWAGEGEEACDEVRTALRLDPQYVEGPYYNLLARVSFVAGRYEDCIDAYKANDTRGGPDAPERLVYWAAACGHLGCVAQAKSLLERFSRTHPNLSLEHLRGFRGTKSDLELARLSQGLRKAGLPE